MDQDQKHFICDFTPNFRSKGSKPKPVFRPKRPRIALLFGTSHTYRGLVLGMGVYELIDPFGVSLYENIVTGFPRARKWSGKKFFKVSEFYFESGKIDVLKKSR